jgi:gentisate 1,2-dioxygenase
VSSRQEIITALLSNSNQLTWRSSSKCREDGPDIELLLQNLAVATVIGAGAPLQSDQVYAGFSLQAPNTYYPPHAHDAEETYWVIGGNGDWRVDSNSWFAVQPGSSIYHKPLAHHAMQTNEQAMLSIWLWTSDLDSEVLIIRG